MKRKILLIFTVLIFLNFQAGISLAAQSKDYAGQTIVVGGDMYFPPFEYVDGSGTYKGFNIDIMHAIAIEMGLDIEIKPMTWKNAAESLQRGNIDVIQGIKYSKNREEIYAFSEPYIESSLAIFIAVDNTYIKSLEDLTGHVVSVQEYDVAYDAIKSSKDITIVAEPSQLEALRSLVKGEVTAFVGNRQTGLYSLQKYHYSDAVKVIGDPINPQPYGLAVQKGNEDLLNVLNEGLRIIKRNGTYDKIHDKWFGVEIYSTREALKNYLYVFITVASLLGLYAFSKAHMNRKLQKEVDRQVKEVEQSNLFKEHIINSIFSGLMTFSTQGIMMSVNEHVEKICKCDPQAYIGQVFSEIPMCAFIDKDLFKSIPQTHGRVFNQESTLEIDGAIRVIEYNMSPIIDKSEKLCGITVTFLDITLRRQNEAQIRRKDKMESLGKLTANIAHEIRNPLTSIKTYIELLPKKIDNAAFRTQLMQDVPAVISRLNDLITELLEYAKPRLPNRETFNLIRPVEEVMHLIEGELIKHRVDYHVDVEDRLEVYFDVQQLKQVLINLLINSIDAVKTREGARIELSAYPKAPYVVLEVKDNGIGISEEDIKQIFEPFFTNRQSGTGLGLSIAHQMIEENGGHISAQSSLGEKTTMTLYLPMDQHISTEAMS
jgi:polar amino acid transport system substrate-binding protein